MELTFKHVVRQLLPPILVPLARHVILKLKRDPPEWQYISDSWPEHDPRQDGWRHPSVSAAQRRRWTAFVEAVRSTRPLGIEHEAERITSENISGQSAFLSFLYVLARAAGDRGSMSVLDWGGGLGYYAVIARTALPLIRLDYTVKELPEICSAGQLLLPDVKFVSDVSCLSRNYDLVFASNALQYAADWRATLQQLATCASDWVFLARLPLVDTANSFVVVQRPHWAGYETEYISWVFNRHVLLAEAQAFGLILEREFLGRKASSAIVGAPEQYRERGFLFRVTRSHPTSHAPEAAVAPLAGC
jgi:putative methyltransferase (TIGR04325 family)